MKPNNTAVRHNTHTPNIEKIGMSIDATATAHIINLLTDLYSDPALAVIREYSTNALDSHIAAGNSAPIEITKPTYEQPNFVVQDYGVGLSRDDIANIYSMYGTSTKRDTDDETGMLGLGCKSALTYAMQFTVDAVKDGEQTIAVISKDERGVGEIQILLNEQTDQPNGVKITVPVDSVGVFNDKLNGFFRFWRGGEVLVDGEPVDSPFASNDSDSEWKLIDPDVAISTKTGWTADRFSYIVMGNVPYRIDTRFDYKFVAFVPMGAIDFTPSREDVMHTPRTNEVIETTKEFINKALQQSFDDDMAQVSDDWDLIRRLNRWTSLLTPQQARQFFASHSKRLSETSDRGWQVDITRNYGGQRAQSSKQQTTIPWQTLGSTKNVEAMSEGSRVILRDFGPKTFTEAHRKRLEHFGFINDDVDTIWVIPASYSRSVDTDSFPGIDWRSVPEVPRQKRTGSGGGGGGGTTAGYPYIIDNQSLKLTSPEQVADDTRTWAYVVSSDRAAQVKRWQKSPYLNDAYGTDTPVVFVTPRQEAKFNKTFPGIVPLDKWREAKIADIKSKLTDEVCRGFHTNPYVRQMLRTFDPIIDKITNDHFLKLLRTHNGFENTLESDDRLTGLAHRFNVPIPTPINYDAEDGRRGNVEEWRRVLYESYPLAHAMVEQPSEHGVSWRAGSNPKITTALHSQMVAYINALDPNPNKE